MEEDSQVPILLGRPFLTTAGAIIDVKNGRLAFNVGKETVEFDLAKLMKNPSIKDSCCMVDIIDRCVEECSLASTTHDGLEMCLINNAGTKLEGDAQHYEELLDKSPHIEESGVEEIIEEEVSPLPKEAPKVELKPLPSNLRLKEALVTAPIIQPPDWNLPFEIMCDASDYAVGAVLGQREDKKMHAIYYASKTLDGAQVNYATT